MSERESVYKLTYFNARGLCEPIRFIFAYAKVNFEDFRVPFQYNGDVPVIPQVLPPEIKESKSKIKIIYFSLGVFFIYIRPSSRKNSIIIIYF